ncbi:MAG: hypothetical protein ACE5GW_13985, partial [Planctomycetota bacterium]
KEGALEQGEVKNHRAWALRLRGYNLHAEMLLELLDVESGEASREEYRVTVEGPGEAILHLPPRFSPGEYALRLNHKETEARLIVIEPRWMSARPAGLKLLRGQERGVEVLLSGTALPELTTEGDRYQMADEAGEALAGSVLEAAEVEPERLHRLVLSPGLSRGRPRVRFGLLDTGVGVRVRRQFHPAVWVTGVVLMLAVLGATGVYLEDRYRPRIAGVEPATVYNFGRPEVRVEGAYLAAVELVEARRGRGARPATDPPRPRADRRGGRVVPLHGGRPPGGQLPAAAARALPRPQGHRARALGLLPPLRGGAASHPPPPGRGAPHPLRGLLSPRGAAGARAPASR